MKNNSKENIIQRLRIATQHIRNDSPYPNVEDDKAIFTSSEESLEVLFAQQFQALGGQFIYCENKDEFGASLSLLFEQNNWTQLHCLHPDLQQLLKDHDINYTTNLDKLMESEASLTSCEALIARTGSILISSKAAGGRSLSIVPPVHIVVATPNQVVYSIKEVLKLYKDDMPSMLCITSGNSRTADIEKTLVDGAHGPKKLYLFLLDQ